MKKYAVIVAGGSGQRMGTSIPKQFLLLQGKPLLWYSLQVFLQAFDDLQIILVVPGDNLAEGERLAKELDGNTRIRVITGGSTRFHSVQNGLACVTSPSIVFVHDGVRCLVSTDLIRRCYTQALEKGSAIPAVAATDSIRVVEGASHLVMDRNRVWIIQTPQTFRSELLLPAFQRDYTEGFTDEATVVEASGEAVYLIDGEYTNIKITRPVDLLVAERILADRSSL
ncbi:MAG: 2-C-methyl-D-erythritol 4-phosphate cytidylyltransferase [Chitinophagaceae bacterium]|nr:2-C-methyl-D-erythritol 4-phosphate cytidylyltransferase [Chitinophagaceae bacterium]MCA6457437.1 2-C-methyl-D-erythritol 4-phosphate cytidylyltransferase [Chitinophagaceae bacterium]MCA6459715.1 2-C-methyl-D-erythritol 4-phosphate cytidylyltransferase [Chitinophagaceae bacterium]MCA6466248.1 2-C-methyl-D-erythritol 4-phosphate cytidylyltransferase [Chitinophagaceae bacterium]